MQTSTNPEGAVDMGDRWDRNQDKLPVCFGIVRTFEQQQKIYSSSWGKASTTQKLISAKDTGKSQSRKRTLKRLHL